MSITGRLRWEIALGVVRADPPRELGLVGTPQNDVTDSEQGVGTPVLASLSTSHWQLLLRNSEIDTGETLTLRPETSLKMPIAGLDS